MSGSTDDQRDPGWVARVARRARRSAAARMAPGTRARAVAIAGRDSVRDVRGAAGAVRERWAAPGALEVPAPPYALWVRSHQRGRSELQAQRASQPTAVAALSVVVLPGAGTVADTVSSLLSQSWDSWSALVLAAVAPGDHDDPRVQVGSGRAELDDWLASAGRGHVVFLRAGDVLAPDAVAEIGAAVRRSPRADLVTWDDDVRGVVRRSPRFRPSWSPELLTAEDYLGSAFAVRATAALAVGGFDPEDRDTGHWDLLLRLAPDPDHVVRVTRVLSSVAERRTAPADAAVAVVRSHVERLALPARAVPGAHGGVRLAWELPHWPRVTVAVPTKHNREVLEVCLASVGRSDYPDLEVVVVDNGGRTPEREAWYAGLATGVPVHVEWWDEPFNYSAVNNLAASRGRGEVLVFLNDDTEVLDPGWLRELVGWAVQPDVGVVGLQLTGAAGLVQHAGVVVGMSGFADHVFAGMVPGSDSLYGPVDVTRNVLAVTGACLAVTREQFEGLGGFDERFVLCGSDVALGLSAVLAGRRNVVSPHTAVRHLESVTRGRTVPVEDYFASYWRYNPWLFQGDPYWNPALSLRSREPRLRPEHEAPPAAWVGQVIGRDLTAYRQRSDSEESRRLAEVCQLRDADVQALQEAHRQVRGPQDVRTVNWFIPDIDSPFYGGINTALRIADQLARVHGVQNRFVVWGSPPDHFFRSALAAAFPALAECDISFYDASMDVSAVPPADVGIATLWSTAYALAKSPGTTRKFYLVQDFEPMFYPAGTQYALAEESYRLGLYGLCNTDNLRRVYEEDYDGVAAAFTPAVDTSVFHARDRRERAPGDPVRVFVYARPGHWRNCWEIASGALTELKRRMGDDVHIVTAGARASGGPADDVMEHRGLLDYRATGDLYRSSDVGLALTVSKHPSYLPLELMACGVPVVAFDNPWGHWLLRDEENSLLARRTVVDIADSLERLCRDTLLRERLAAHGLADIAARHSDWDAALAGVHGWLTHPDGGA